MKLMKSSYIVTAVIALFTLMNFSCTQESLSDSVIPQENEFSNPMDGDVLETNPQETVDMRFTVFINETEFVPSKIKTTIDGDKINILATDETLDRSVFLIFIMDTGTTLPLGRSHENTDGNTAGYLFNGENKGFVTSEMPQICGYIKISEINTDTNIISGTFEFDACNIVDDVLNFQDGIFENIPWSVQ